MGTGKQVATPYHLQRYGFLDDNEHLRNCLSGYMKANKITLGQISRDLKIDKGDLSKYFNKKKNRALSDFNILSVCRYFNIKLTLKIEIDERGSSPLHKRKGE